MNVGLRKDVRTVCAAIAVGALASIASCGSSDPATSGGNAGGAAGAAGAGEGGGAGAGDSGRGGNAGGSGTAGAGGTPDAGPADATDDGLIGWATRHANGAPTGGQKPIGEFSVMTCTAADMKTLRDCLYRAKKSDKTNTDTRPTPPDWSTWEVHAGVTGGWKKYPLIIYVKGVIDCAENDAGVRCRRPTTKRATRFVKGARERPANRRSFRRKSSGETFPSSEFPATTVSLPR
ncbi:MAG TPA: hypothetical protein VK540_20805 [Polyangiaceae bacterium]|nr:hypothetical protein [Polyangiaceae bacterium]